MLLNIINTWQFNIILYIIFAVSFSQLYKFAVRNLTNDGAGTIVLQTTASLITLIFIPFFPLKFSSDWRVYFFLTLACIFYAVNDRLQTTIRKNLEVSIYSILGQLTSVFLIMIGLTFFHEPFSLTKMIGAILILLSNVILSYKKEKFKLNKYVVLNTLACLSLSIALSIDIDISKYFNLPIYIIFTLAVPSLIIKISEKISFKKIKEEIISGEKKYFLLTGLAWSLLIIFMLRSYQLSSVTLITPLAATTVLINVLVATLFFEEKKNIFKKIISALITIIGVYLTVI